ncbi:MAG: hypothetical protein FWF52_09550 [Candidatus Azobacteroides sp.]|nr:hypothetical protein [Candidatus Azobacteroides sp.]
MPNLFEGFYYKIGTYGLNFASVDFGYDQILLIIYDVKDTNNLAGFVSEKCVVPISPLPNDFKLQ